MRVRFVLPNSDGEKPKFDKTVSLPAVPSIGDSIGIDLPEDHPFAGSAWIVEVESRRWYIEGEEPLVEIWLTEESRANQYVHSGCRYGYEQMMASITRFGE